jgi:hypothetical protein
VSEGAGVNAPWNGHYRPLGFRAHYAGNSHENHDDRAAFRDGQLSVAEELVKTSDCQGATKLADGSIQIKSFDGPIGKMTDMRNRASQNRRWGHRSLRRV